MVRGSHMTAETLYLARSVSLAAASDSVQMFPPGKQVVTPSRADGKEPTEIELTIDEQTAADLEALRAELQAKADAGEGDAPYFDFNHSDGEASAWPKRIFWAGDDPLLGGVRAEVEWTAAGEAAVQGKTFRRFSPAFYAGNGRITGAPTNMGGLVNRAAFTRIQPLFAKEPDPQPTPQPETNTMNEEEIAALQQENATLKSALEELQAKLGEMNKKEAEATVAMAAKEGRIGTDPALQAKWVESILKDPSAKDLLLAMAPHAALTEKVIDPKRTAEKEVVQDAAALLAKYDELPREEKPVFFAKHAAELKQARDKALRA
jgi:phage I-like protein